MAKTPVFTEVNLSLYDQLVKQYVDAADVKSIKAVTISGNALKFYKISDPVDDSVPAYTIELPETDLSEINKAIADINNETTGILATAKGYTDTKVSELADGQVKSNKEAIAVLNGADTVEGSVAKSIKDLKTTLDADIATAKASGDNAQADVDALEAKIGTVPEDKTVVQMIADAQTAATYNDTEVRGLIKDNADAIEAHKTAIDDKVTTLVGTDTNKSVRTIANEELAAQLIPEGAKESLDTLQEIASWIQSHPDDASAMNQAITALQTLVGTIPEGATATDIVNYIKELVDAEKTRATGIESGLDTRLSAVEALVGEGGSVDDKIATAKQEAIDAAAADATTKANTAESNAKTYADGLNTAIDTRVASIESKVGEGFEPISESFIRGLFA